MPLLLDFSRTWRAKDLGVGRLGREWVDMPDSDSELSRLPRGRARELTEEEAEEEAYSYVKGPVEGVYSKIEPCRRLRSRGGRELSAAAVLTGGERGEPWGTP